MEGEGVQGYIDEHGNVVYLHDGMMGSEDDEDGMGHDGDMGDSYG